jgi:16S rRNA (cytidine1402-2'-O)-methyltransferase
MPSLYLIATPIGNLEDISLRALRTLREVSLIAAEDTRRARKLLTAYDIKTPLVSYHEHNKELRQNDILEALDGGDVALISDAGMPGISDPGYELVVAAREHDVPVVPIPGASAVTTALAVSGLPTDRFLYLGFLPRRQSARREALSGVAGERGTLVVLEAPHRLRATLKDIREVLGDREIAVGREMTKLHEEIFRGTVGEAEAHFTKPRGEFTLVIRGAVTTAPSGLDEAARTELAAMRRAGVPAKEAVAKISAQTGLSRREIYHTWLKLPRD